MRRSLLYKCLLASACIHGGVLSFVATRALSLAPSASSLFGTFQAPSLLPLDDEDISLSEKNIALEEVFNSIIVLSPQFQTPYDYIQLPSDARLPRKEAAQLPTTSATVPWIDVASPPDHDTAPPALTIPSPLLGEIIPPTFAAAPIVSAMAPHPDFSSYLRELQTTPPLADDRQSLSMTLPSVDIHYPAEAEAGRSIELPVGKASILPPTPRADFLALIPLDQLLGKAPQFSHDPITAPHLSLPASPLALSGPLLSPLESYGLPTPSFAAEWSDAFTATVQTSPREGGGFSFAITLTPKYDMTASSIPQHYDFVIDRSSSVEKFRFQTFKRAVLRAISSLQPGDSFNITLLDEKMTRLSPSPLPSSKKSFTRAEEFLEREAPGGFFTKSDLSTFLKSLSPTSDTDSSLHTIVLLTDGKAGESPEKQRRLVQAWARQNRGRFQLFTATTGQGNNLPFLDLLSTLSRGSLLYSDTHAAFPRKLAKLILDLRHPLAKEISVSAVKGHPDSHVRLYPPAARLHPLFHRPYTLFGVADQLTTFTLVIHGKGKGEGFTLRKEISLQQGVPMEPQITQEWSKEEAYLKYDEYVEKGSVAILKKAEELLGDRSARKRL